MANKALDILLGEDKIEKRQEKQVKVKRLGVVFTLQCSDIIESQRFASWETSGFRFTFF